MSTSTAQRYLLLPPRGLQTSASPQSMHLGPMMLGLQPQASVPAALGGAGLRVIDTVHENGIKLVEMSDAAMLKLRLAAPGLRIVPEVFYRTARLPMAGLAAKVAPAAAGATVLRFEVPGSTPVAGATVIAYTDYANGIGAQGRTRKDGSVRLALGGAARIQRLYVYPDHGVWPLLMRNVALPRSKPIALARIDLGATDALRYFAARAPAGDGQGVTVGIVDTGVGPHGDVPLAGGANTVVGESPADIHDNGEQHGTHVAGIVGARGVAPAGMRGLAPAVALRSYRVFGAGGQLASNYSIAKAIDIAVSDGCDLINMSLGGGPADPAISAAIADARAAGVVVICASGNDGADEVSQPAADSRAVAVGAFGRKDLLPARSISAEAVGRLGKDPRNFMADFSNHGQPVDLAGPGVGIVSTVPGGRWAVMDGTSMACPAVTGATARLLAADAALLALARGQQRSDAILQKVFQAARSLGFGAEYEGYGWPMK
ncbi:MAG: S8 family serine peptidase [Rubrivivax sp.]|nr:S8 family serine peptidase [Rubrivivax sp.]